MSYNNQQNELHTLVNGGLLSQILTLKSWKEKLNKTVENKNCAPLLKIICYD